MKSSEISIYREVSLMRDQFPSFRFRRGKHERFVPTWYGQLAPTATSLPYQIKITYANNTPKVWVLCPQIKPNAPHRYRDRSLCLYYPDDKSWTPEMGIANSIVLWAAEWLFFYEHWCMTGDWLGKSAPHETANSETKGNL